MTEINNLFAVASRLKFRFETPRGSLTVEDLWNLPLTSRTGKVNLDDIARSLYRDVKDMGDEVSFVAPIQKADEIPGLKLELVKYIISVLVSERDTAAQEAVRREKKQRLLELIVRKEDETLAGKSLDELRAMVEQL
ncbi:MAG: hypothetical protein WC169_12440 [Dehalococcoidia bacterium]